MVIEVKRKRGESFEAHLRRFQRVAQKSGLKRVIQKCRFRARKKSRNEQRRQTLRRLERNAMKEYLRRTGRLEESPRF